MEKKLDSCPNCGSKDFDLVNDTDMLTCKKCDEEYLDPKRFHEYRNSLELMLGMTPEFAEEFWPEYHRVQFRVIYGIKSDD